MSTTFDQIYQYGGVPVGTPLFTCPIKTQRAQPWFVRPGSGSDGDEGHSPQRALKTLAEAQSRATANNGEVVYLIAESNTAGSTTDYQSVQLNWAKDGVHLIGVGASSMIGSRARVSQLSTANAVTGGLLKISANGCFVSNLEVFMGAGANNPSAATYAMVVTGSRNVVKNCQISGIGDTTLDDAGSCSLYVDPGSGGENQFIGCYIGLDTVIRATATEEVNVNTGTRTIFDNCFINTYTSLTTFKLVKCGTPDRFVLLKDCTLNAVQNITSSASPTGAINSGSVNGSVLLHNTAVFGCVNVTTANDSKTLISAPAGDLVDMGLATAALIA